MSGDPTFFRGGASMTPSPRDYRIDLQTGLLRPGRGISVMDRPDGLERFGGAYRLTNIPATLRIIQVGRDAHHFEVVPAVPMTLDDYVRALAQITLVADA